jgi:hypothetical protein
MAKRNEMKQVNGLQRKKTMQEVHLDKKTLQNLMDYRGMSLVRMAGINVLMSMMQREDIDPLRKLFQEID